MTKTIRLALIGASILSIASPALAWAAKSDRLTCYQAASGQQMCNSPASLQVRPRGMPSPRPGIYDANPNAGYGNPFTPTVGGDVL